ncbi:substrate-binding domain-containing protein [Pseudoalteromonas sp. OOF1S-7]|uniref:substrate-binding domain-containing protein n=1 Tax=Pseudoalteromonas sp. OOF1S-7 TaxID=2917757 RepID=UPI001EF4BA48|nr:substrate-binding domain-containing protein [Pseudoalteromonas sp. OOF1S-7]MCG7535700.1 substrate-binding domain-containing protein [Pseudoalteromonas sp. OOF1S-7]
MSTGTQMKGHRRRAWLSGIFAAAALCATSMSWAAQSIDWSKAAKSSDIHLTKQQSEAIKSKGLTAALVWHGASPWVAAVSRGARDEFEKLGIKVVAATDAQFDPAKQVADLENIAALNPDIILSLSVDGVSTRQSYAKAIERGAKLVLLSNPIPGFEQGKDFVGIVTDDMFGMGKAAADLTAKALDNTGKVGMIYHDASYFITNNRDNAYRKGLKAYPELNVIIEKGFIKEHETSNVAAAMVLQHPELEAIYVSWDAAAEGVVEALRSLGRRDIKVITHDLGVNNLLDMAMGGNVYGTISDRPFDIGQTMARLGAASTLGLPAPHFTLVPFDTVKRDNIAEIWQRAFQSPLPRLLNLALKQ